MFKYVLVLAMLLSACSQPQVDNRAWGEEVDVIANINEFGTFDNLRHPAHQGNGYQLFYSEDNTDIRLLTFSDGTLKIENKDGQLHSYVYKEDTRIRNPEFNKDLSSFAYTIYEHGEKYGDFYLNENKIGGEDEVKSPFFVENY